jgi:hypothetical protein
VTPPPHFRPLRAVKKPALFYPPPPHLTIRSPQLRGPAGPPQYTITCYPADTGIKNPGIPCGTGIPQDLIFSIIQQPNTGTGGDYNLMTFTIVLELAGAPDNPRWGTCLLKDYQGPGPVMLSNLRFIVQAQVVDDEKHGRCLALRVIPRSTKGMAAPEMCEEMSFVLPVCRVLPHDVTVQIAVWITPEYDGYVPVTTPSFNVITFPQ